jgi:hypothetical protein
MSNLTGLLALSAVVIVVLVFLGCALSGPSIITNHHPQHGMAERLAEFHVPAEGRSESGAPEQWQAYADRTS